MHPAGRAEARADSICARHGALHRGLAQRGFDVLGSPDCGPGIEGPAHAPQRSVAAVRLISVHGCRLGGCGRPARRGQVSAGLEHPDPARLVAADHQGLVVGFRVSVRRAGPQDGMDDAEHLVRGGDDGALLAFPQHQRLVAALEPAALRAGRGLRAFRKRRPQVPVALDRPPGAALAAALVVARAQAGP